MQPVIQSYGENQAADVTLCKRILDRLHRHYPGHPWYITADHRTGIARIFLLYPDPNDKTKKVAKAGCLMHIANLESPRGMKQVMIYGGELLERFNLPRKAAAADSFQRAKANGLDLTGVMK